MRQIAQNSTGPPYLSYPYPIIYLSSSYLYLYLSIIYHLYPLSILLSYRWKAGTITGTAAARECGMPLSTFRYRAEIYEKILTFFARGRFYRKVYFFAQHAFFRYSIRILQKQPTFNTFADIFREEINLQKSTLFCRCFWAFCNQAAFLDGPMLLFCLLLFPLWIQVLYTDSTCVKAHERSAGEWKPEIRLLTAPKAV